MSAIRTVRSGMVPTAAFVAVFTALAAVTVHARHVADGYRLQSEVRRTVRLEREIQRLESRRAELTTPSTIEATAERLGVPLQRPTGRQATTIDLDAHVRARVAPIEDTIWARNVR